MGGGILAVFEQTGPRKKSGRLWHLRPCQQYQEWAEKYGMVLQREFTIAFPLFRFYENTVLRGIKVLFPGRSTTEKSINANQSRMVNALSEWILCLSGNGLSHGRDSMGNTLFVFEKAAECL